MSECRAYILSPSLMVSIRDFLCTRSDLSLGIHRAEHLFVANDALAKMLSKHDDDLLAVPVLPSEVAKPAKRMSPSCGSLSYNSCRSQASEVPTRNATHRQKLTWNPPSERALKKGNLLSRSVSSTAWAPIS